MLGFSNAGQARFDFTATVYTAQQNRAPVANAGKNSNALVSFLNALDGSFSYDPDGDLITYQWSMVQSPTGSLANLLDPSRPDPSFIPDLVGAYRFDLIVNDGKKPSDTAHVTVTAFDSNAPPNARAGKVLSVLLGTSANLNGSDSSDPNDLPLEFVWSFLSLAPGSTLTDADILARDTATPRFTPDVKGEYSLKLLVNNGLAAAEDTVQVIAGESNVRPNADAGTDKAGQTGKPIILDGSASFDPDNGPSPLAFSWQLMSRPAQSALTTANIADAKTSTPTLTPDVLGTYLFRLTVSDGTVIDSDNVVLIADNSPPNLQFLSPTDGSKVTTRTPQFQLAFNDGDGSGIDLSTFKLQVNGVDVTQNTSVSSKGGSYKPASGLASGDNSASAQVADRAGNMRTLAIRFTVSIFEAIADCAPTSGPAPLTVRFRSRGEFTGGSIVRYRWDFQGDGVFDTSDSVATDYTRTLSTVGIYNAVLEVTNNLGQKATANCPIQVSGNAPTVTANATPSNGPILLAVSLTCTATARSGASIARYEWDFEGDGTYDYSSTASGTVSHSYSEVGTFNAECRVTDSKGLTALARTTTTTIRPAPGGPSVTASSAPASGNAPLRVTFNGSAVPSASIVRWEWDFEGDGVYDYSSTTSPSTSFTYTNAGIFAASLRATDNAGLSNIDTVEVIVNATVSLTIPADTFEPGAGATAGVKTTLSAGLPIKILFRDASGAVVRTLVDQTRAAGTFTDTWDGRDDAGNLLPEGPYYAIVQYQFGNEVRTLDLTNTTGGTRYNPSRNSLPSTFRPFEDNLLAITFTIPATRGASEIQAFVGLFNTDTRLVTLLNRLPLGVGTHTIYWDGLDSNGKFAVPPAGDSLLFGIFGYTLPDNAIFLQAAPDISNVTVDPNYYDPSTPDFITPANPLATMTFNLNKAAYVELTVTNLTTGRVLRRIRQLNVAAGTGRTISWDGHAEDGLFADKGDYRLSLQAISSNGSASLTRYALVRVYY